MCQIKMSDKSGLYNETVCKAIPRLNVEEFCDSLVVGREERTAHVTHN